MSEPNYRATNFFTERLLVIEMKKTETLTNKPVYLGLSILELSQILMYEFCSDYVKLKIKIALYGYRHFHCIHKNR